MNSTKTKNKGMEMTTKISSEHLQRDAIVYIRQSTAGQVLRNRESQRVQYRLSERAESLGWPKERIQVVDEDLGVSACGSETRRGFDYLVSQVCESRVGAILSVDASRLARNGREWHTLLELSGLVEVLLIDHTNIYDPMLSDDRLLLGLKGEMSAMELRILRERSQAALREKAQRGELYLGRIAVGYQRSKQGRLKKDPDQRVQEAIELIFQKFDELGSLNKVCQWFRDNSIMCPVSVYQEGERQTSWKLPLVNTINRVITNPCYAGAYAFGRRRQVKSIEHGQQISKLISIHDRSQWHVLITEHHEGYISWEKYLANMEIIKHNTNMKSPLVKGAVKQGQALLTGILRCGHCGRRLYVAYGGQQSQYFSYNCRGTSQRTGGNGCIRFAGAKVDDRVVEQILEAVSPLGIQAAERASEFAVQREDEIAKQHELALEQAQYEAKRARRAYHAVDPENRLVAANLERAWENALNEVDKLKSDISQLSAARSTLSANERAELEALADDLPRIWSDPLSSTELKKRIARTVIREIVAYVEEPQIRLVIHWEGGIHSEVSVRKNKTGEHRYKADPNIVQLVTDLAKIISDAQIAVCLNRLGVRSSKNLTWTRKRLASFRNNRGIPSYCEADRKLRGDLTFEETVELLNISKSMLWRLIQDKVIPAKQACKGAPWIIRQADLASDAVQKNMQKRAQSTPFSADSQQLNLRFQ